MSKYRKLFEKLNTLIYYRDILNHEVIKALLKLLKYCDIGDDFKIIKHYYRFISMLFKYSNDISIFIKNLIKININIYIKKYAEHKYIYENETDAIYSDIRILQQVCDLKASDFESIIVYDKSKLPVWKNTGIDLRVIFDEYLTNIDKIGYGIFSQYYIFKMTKNLIPIKNPDNITLNDFTGYQKQRDLLIKNTLSLLSGNHASNVLLYGDSGTGKSSTVKAIVNKFHNEGLRLIEVDQTHLHRLPDLMEIINKQPLKFIIFIDDLSFAKENKDFNALKAILEGSTIVSGNNCVIYATSNRRHLIKENFNDRNNNDIHANETVQQLTALSDRFGLKINFGIPNKNIYLNIVDSLIDSNKCLINKDILHQKAEAFAITQGNRSPRTACQFVRLLIDGII